jgi:hypothetical protein
VSGHSDLNDKVLCDKIMRIGTTFSGDIEQILEKKFRGIGELFNLIYLIIQI